MNKKFTNLEVKREQLYYEASLNYLKPVYKYYCISLLPFRG